MTTVPPPQHAGEDRWATRPGEHLCFFPLKVPTKEGDAVMFLVVDVFSKFLLMTGEPEEERSNGAVLRNVRKLMEHPDLLPHLDKGFTIIFHEHEDIRKDIEAIIGPFGGSMVVDDATVAKEMEEPIRGLMESLSTKGHGGA